MVVIHDSTLERTTDGHGAVADLPWSALSTLDAGAWFDPAFLGEPVPRLEQLLDTVTRHTTLCVELKAGDSGGGLWGK